MDLTTRIRRHVVMAMAVIVAVVTTITPVSAAEGPDAATPSERGRLRTQVAHEAVTHAWERIEPVREPSGVHTANVTVMTVQSYHDTCGDSRVGDLLQFDNRDTGAIVGWLWSTCADRGFLGTDDELLLMQFYDLDLPSSTAPDFAVLQWPVDGYFEVYDARRRLDPDEWLLVENGFGEVGGSHGRVTDGFFVFDAAGAWFPERYEFAAATGSGGQILDVLPKPGHPTPAYPTDCTRIDLLPTEIVLEDGTRYDDVADRIAAAGATVRGGVSLRHGIVIVEGADAWTLARLAAIPAVRSVQRSRPVDPAQISDRWHLEQLNVAPGWANVPTAPTHIAVIDDGVDVTHPAVANAVGAGYDSVAQRGIPAGRSTNMGYHGTSVASMIVGDGTAGVFGINPRATIRPVTVTSHDGCISTDRVATAILAAAEMPEVDVINISLGGSETFAERAAVDVAERAGKIVVAASGNDQQNFPGRPNYPAALSNVIGVGATTPSGQLAAFSQTAAADVLAPGDDVRVAASFGGSDVAGGTSFAAPLVAGALATWLVDHPTATTSQARDALRQASVPVDGSAAPRLDVVRLLTGHTPPPDPHLPFRDIAGTIHEQAILAVADAGITGGYPDGTFRPSGQVTRGQMATFLTKALGLTPTNPPFTDAIGTTHAAAIGAVEQAGITGGYPDGTFRPNHPVTRGQMATFLSNALDLTG